MSDRVSAANDNGTAPAPRAAFLVGLVLAAAFARLIPHPPNFGPVGAMALFGGARFRSRWAAYLMPLGAMFLADLALEATTRLGLHTGWMAGGKGFYQGMWIVYGSILLITVVGRLLPKRESPLPVAGGVLASSVLFFLVTNFAWWWGYDLYPHTWDGLVLCYLAGLEFFPWTLLGDACYATILFGGFAMAQRRLPVLQPAAT